MFCVSVTVDPKCHSELMVAAHFCLAAAPLQKCSPSSHMWKGNLNNQWHEPVFLQTKHKGSSSSKAEHINTPIVRQGKHNFGLQVQVISFVCHGSSVNVCATNSLNHSALLCWINQTSPQLALGKPVLHFGSALHHFHTLVCATNICIFAQP